MAPLYKAVSALGNSEIMVATTLLMALGTSLLTLTAGLSTAMGAFLAGLVLAETDYALQARVMTGDGGEGFVWGGFWGDSKGSGCEGRGRRARAHLPIPFFEPPTTPDLHRIYPAKHSPKPSPNPPPKPPSPQTLLLPPKPPHTHRSRATSTPTRGCS